MGTRGLIAYRYKGVYYIKYNHLDSYPEALGVDLVRSIPEDPEEFQRWLERKRACFEGSPEVGKFDEEVEEEPEEDEEIPNAADPMATQLALYKRYLKKMPKYEFERSSESPAYTDIADIEWTYTFDLDNLAFTIQNDVHLRLNNLPRGPEGDEWIKLVYVDGLLGACRSPHGADDAYYTNSLSIEPLSEQEKQDLELFKATAFEEIDTSTWIDAPGDGFLSLSEKLSVITTKGLIAGNFAEVSIAHSKDKEEKFDAIAKEILTAASPAGSMFSADGKQISDWCSAIKVGGRGGAGSKRPGQSIWWFRGRLVILSRCLDTTDMLKSSAGKALRYARESGLGECTAILWSINHIAVVVVSGDKVSCSEAIPVLASFNRDEAKFAQAMRLIAHYLPPPCIEGSPYFGSRLSLDIFTRVMEFTDPISNEALGRTSKALRVEWLRRPAIGRYTLLSAQDDGFTAIYRRRERTSALDLVELHIRLPACKSLGAEDEDEEEEEDPHSDSNSELPQEKEKPLHVVYRRSYYYEPFSQIGFELFTQHSG